MAGKSNRKHGRNKRKPTNQRYKSEMRWEKNKKRNIHNAKMEVQRHILKRERRASRPKPVAVA